MPTMRTNWSRTASIQLHVRRMLIIADRPMTTVELAMANYARATRWTLKAVRAAARNGDLRVGSARDLIMSSMRAPRSKNSRRDSRVHRSPV